VPDPRAFVSFDFDHDETARNLFAGQAKKDSPTPFVVQDWSSRRRLPQATWEAQMRKRIAATNMCIVLVGTSVATATGVAKEIAMAKGNDVPVFGVYMNGAGSNSTLPAGLARSRTVAWRWPGIAAWVDQAMTEGKNA
jgi:Thoeris protein ThsB, TIR-like domain